MKVSFTEACLFPTRELEAKFLITLYIFVPQVIAILAVYTWSMMQFSVVTTAVEKNDDDDDVTVTNNDVEKYVVVANNDDGSDTSTTSNGKQAAESTGGGWLCWHSELPELFVGLFVQDGPFLVMRVYLCTSHESADVSEEPHIFFLCKNAFICVLYLYRLVVLVCENENQQQAPVVRQQSNVEEG